MPQEFQRKYLGEDRDPYTPEEGLPQPPAFKTRPIPSKRSYPDLARPKHQYERHYFSKKFQYSLLVALDDFRLAHNFVKAHYYVAW